MTGCFERTPYVSLISCVLLVTGVGLMCGTNYEAFRRTNFVFSEMFYPITSPELFQTIGIVCATVTLVLGIFNVSFGAMTTGETRRKFYAHKRAQSTGMNYARLLSAITYLFTAAWIFLFILFAVPVSLWVMLHSVCYEETEYWRRISADKDETHFTYTFNLTNYGLYRRPLDTGLYSESVNSPSAFTQLCQEISTVGPLFAISLIASLLVIVGLICFIACLANASVRLELTAEIDRVRGFPDPHDELAIPLMTTQSPLSVSRLDTQPNRFSYTNASGTLYSYQSGVNVPFATDTTMHQPTSMFRPVMRQ